ncbi:MAG: PTS sugar transporter subunit IIA, partial [Anaerococcus sp.]|nr:PTS sugar transporter subunit IIA [Peptoniphilaceae bacterium]MDY3055188.1 PTS sugar transporter subunit IIA [Anaerococcus sp.]
NGKVVSKMLESQLYNYLPTIKIVGVVSIYELENIKEDYDYIISTVELEGYDNVILVKPILTSYNILELYQNLLNINSIIYEQDIDKIIEIVDLNAEIENRQKLKMDLIDYFINKNKKRELTNNDIKLSDLIRENRVKKIKKVCGYEAAVRIASQVLLDDKSINERYIEDMLKNIEKYGSYIVITEDVALPHANNNESVNKVDVSILSVEEGFDIKGKKVELIIVVCPIDNNKHLKMLGTISDILEKKENINILKSANYREIVNLIDRYE